MPPTLTTDRLILRPFSMKDADAAYEIFEEHPDVWRYDPGFQRTREQRDRIIDRYAEYNDEGGCGTLAVTLRADGTLIGYVGLQLYVLPRVPLATPEVELYYKFGRAYWGKGYATEACQAMLDFAFTRMRLARIVTVASRLNQESIRLMQRLGMKIEDAPPSWPSDVIGTLENNRL